MISTLLAIPLLFNGGLALSPVYAVRRQSDKSQEPFYVSYPLEPLRDRVEGDSSFEVRGDKKGQPKNCKITSSSGHPSLDKETCKQAMKRARWVVDPNVKEYVYSDTLQWRLDYSPPAGAILGYYPELRYPSGALNAGTEGVSKVEIAIDSNGAPKSCKIIQSAGRSDLDKATCDWFMQQAGFRSNLDDNGKPQPVVIQSINWTMSAPPFPIP
ncbi:energy transducer TonB [Sphingopyxis sp. Root1497]|uniref:energy transducer TonB n=1 Tax=Sphingopyxis sp. Root1497 TaxID=1736474 RepID=UPI0009E8AE54|nr:energy transducer TonB [Sphingopyxis sp. Root1497]